VKDRGPSKLTVDCDICGEPMTIDRHRYLALIRAGQRPRCRRNGCERLCGAKTPGTARSGQTLEATGDRGNGVMREKGAKKRSPRKVGRKATGDRGNGVMRETIPMPRTVTTAEKGRV